MWQFLSNACCMATLIIVLVGPSVVNLLAQREERRSRED